MIEQKQKLDKSESQGEEGLSWDKSKGEEFQRGSLLERVVPG